MSFKDLKNKSTADMTARLNAEMEKVHREFTDYSW